MGKLRLTERDYRIFDCLYQTQILTTSILCTWPSLFPSNPERLKAYHHTHHKIGKPFSGRLNWCRRRLRKLCQAGYLFSTRLPEGMRQGHRPELIYGLTQNGLELYAQWLGVSTEDMLWDSSIEEITERSDFQHLLELNMVWGRIFASAAERDLLITKWRHDWQLQQEEPAMVYVKTSPGGTPQKRGIRPDGWFQLPAMNPKQPHRIPLSFLEHERGTVTGEYSEYSKSGAEGKRDWRQKVLALVAYYTPREENQPSLLEQQFGSDSLRILTTLTSEEKLAHRKRITENNGGGVGDYFWFTTLDRVLAPETNFFYDRIWQVAGREGMYSLIQ